MKSTLIFQPANLGESIADYAVVRTVNDWGPYILRIAYKDRHLNKQITLPQVKNNVLGLYISSGNIAPTHNKITLRLAPLEYASSAIDYITFDVSPHGSLEAVSRLTMSLVPIGLDLEQLTTLGSLGTEGVW